VKRGVEIVTKTRRAPTFTAQSVDLCWPPYLCWIFYFFVGKYYTQKVLVVFVFWDLILYLYLFLESFLEKETIPYQNRKDSLYWGKPAAGTKATAGNGWEKGMGMTEGTEYME
jgi:hypothetical protein